MQVFLTNINTPIRCKKPNGTINLHTLKLWPAWSFPEFTTLFSYERDGEKIVVPVVIGKTYTFRDLELLVNEHFNRDAALYYKDGKVGWYVTPADPPNISNIKLSKRLKELLKLENAQKHLGITIGQPINKSSINFTFSDAAMVFLTCYQIEASR